MPPTWVIERFRSNFLRENLQLMVLSYLRQAPLTEWEILDILHSKHETTPGDKEFRKLVDSLTEGGFADSEWVSGNRKLRLNRKGLDLQLRLEREYKAIISRLNAFSAAEFARTRP